MKYDPQERRDQQARWRASDGGGRNRIARMIYYYRNKPDPDWEHIAQLKKAYASYKEIFGVRGR